MRQSDRTPRQGRFYCVTLLTALWGLTGCQSALAPFGAVGDALHYVIQPKSPPPAVHLPGHEYILIEVNGRHTGAVLGQRTVTEAPSGPVVDEHWYSAGRELIHLRNGRLQTVWGMPTEWRGQRSLPPSWSDVQAQALRWSRQRDEMPHYRFGVIDSMQTQASAAPPTSAPANLSKPGHSVRWVQDRVESTTAQGQAWAYVQHFALVQDRVVYSEQCIAPPLCLRIRHQP